MGRADLGILWQDGSAITESISVDETVTVRWDHFVGENRGWYSWGFVRESQTKNFLDSVTGNRSWEMVKDWFWLGVSIVSCLDTWDELRVFRGLIFLIELQPGWFVSIRLSNLVVLHRSS